MKLVYILCCCLMICSCSRPERNRPHAVSSVDKAENKLHGVWESQIIRTREKSPPKRITLKIATYNKSKLIYLQMIAVGPRGQKLDSTIQVVTVEKNGGTYLVPVVRKQLEASKKKGDNKFINYNPKHQKEVEGLEWKYTITDDHLKVEMGLSSITFKRIK